ncbi:MAG TPA: hypothetical protein VKY74_20650 [Chloroflexia bacterium]|nr:hypothetical protein [Chloroflexia bacterium]
MDDPSMAAEEAPSAPPVHFITPDQLRAHARTMRAMADQVREMRAAAAAAQEIATKFPHLVELIHDVLQIELPADTPPSETITLDGLTFGVERYYSDWFLWLRQVCPTCGHENGTERVDSLVRLAEMLDRPVPECYHCRNKAQQEQQRARQAELAKLPKLPHMKAFVGFDADPQVAADMAASKLQTYLDDLGLSPEVIESRWLNLSLVCNRGGWIWTNYTLTIFFKTGQPPDYDFAEPF